MLALTSFGFYVWAAVMVAHAILIIRLQTIQAEQHIPAFVAYNYGCLIAGLASAFTTALGTPMLAYWSYISFSVAISLLTMLVALEIYIKVFGPKIAVPDWVPRRVATMVASAVGLALTVAILGPVNGGPLTRSIERLEFGTGLTLMATFVILLGYSRALHYTWRKQHAGIALGFVLYLSTTLISIYVRARFPLQAARASYDAGMAAYLGTVVFWLVTAWGRIELPVRPTEKEIESIDDALGRIKATFGKT